MHSLTIEALEKFDDQHDFERMSSDVLNAEGHSDVTLIAPRGGSDEGKDLIFTTRDGRKGLGCATTGYKDNIERKFYADFSQRKPDEYQVYIFFCTAYISSSKKEKFRQYVSENLHAELIIRDIEALRSLLDTTCQYIRKHFLHIDVEHHTWSSLLSACKEHRGKILKRYSGKYEPSSLLKKSNLHSASIWPISWIFLRGTSSLKARESCHFVTLFVTLSRRSYGKMLSCKVTHTTRMDRRCILFYFSEPDARPEGGHAHEDKSDIV